MTFTLVAGAAPLPDEDAFYRALVGEASFVVAADAAGEWCASLGRVPDVALGDFDSALPGARDRLAAMGAEVISFPREKDETDLELAIDVARRRFRGPIVLTAAYSGLLDHTLAALGALMRAGDGASVREPGWSGHLVVPGHPLRVRVDRGTTFSVLAVGEAEGVDVSGAKWPLVGATLPPLSGRGVSNVTSGDELVASVREGALIVLIRHTSGTPYTL
jgi:thiamine pyrophosphokinase